MAPKRDIFAQVMGFLVFLVGLGVILSVLYLALKMFQDDKLGIHASSGPSISATDLGVGFGALVLKIALLFLGSISGSLISNKGIQLYFTGAGITPPRGRGKEILVDVQEETAVPQTMTKPNI